MSPTPLRYFHNPRCSKSRAALELLRAHGVEPELVAYLETPPSEEELHRLLECLDMAPRALLRTGEEAYRALGLDDPTLDDAALVAAMHAHPRLIERPILVNGNRAAIGRPPERVLEILD